MARIIRGINDLETWCRQNNRQSLLHEWDYEKNSDLDITEIGHGSEKKAWWKCQEGHVWQAKIVDRCCGGNGCPYCSGRKTLKGYNDFKTWCNSNGRIELLTEWYYEKNDVSPSTISPHNHKKIWWKCAQGHIWRSEVASRVGLNTGCPYCSGNLVIKGENDLQTLYPELVKEWHPTRNGDLLPSDVKSQSNKKVWWLCAKGHEWKKDISKRVNGSGCPYCSGNLVTKGENDLQALYPELAKEWHSTRNGDLLPSDVKPHSNKIVWWKCDKDHEWKVSINSRTSNDSGCPYCSNRRVLKGYNDFATTHPEIAKEWHPIKNGTLKPTDVSYGMSNKIWWKCVKGHEWRASINARTSNDTGCPVCSNHKLLSGYNDLATIQPELVKEWHPIKNGRLTPSDVLAGSYKKVWWVCHCGHEWEAVISSRSKGHGCPKCASIRNAEIRNKDRISHVGSLQERCPELAKEWHPSMNGKLKPMDVLISSNKMVWWLGECGHEWKAVIYGRVQGHGCPFCSNRKLLSGYNDLATVYPEIAKEWHPTRNGNIQPNDVLSGANIKVWWMCANGHEWQSTVNSRSNQKTGCPICSGKGTSLPEQGISFYLEQVCEVKQRIKICGNELDVFLPEYNIGIEYDGRYYHTQDKRQKENYKDKIIEKKGIFVIRIKESDENRVDYNYIYFKTDNMGANYDWALMKLGKMLTGLTNNVLFKEINVNAQRDFLRIRERMDLYLKNNSVALQYPDLAKEWNYEKNGKLTPEVVASKANIKVWWKCSKGHEWQALVSNRTNLHRGCPECGYKTMSSRQHKTLLSKKLSLAENNPALVGEWHPTKNGSLSPDDVLAGSNTKVWWLGKCGHEWEALIANRAKKNSGCPICAKYKNYKKVLNVDSGMVFKSVDEAAQYCGLKSSSGITQCCRGVQKTAGGYRWKYVEE